MHGKYSQAHTKYSKKTNFYLEFYVLNICMKSKSIYGFNWIKEINTSEINYKNNSGFGGSILIGGEYVAG